MKRVMLALVPLALAACQKECDMRLAAAPALGIPPIDKDIPEKLETATFALG